MEIHEALKNKLVTMVKNKKIPHIIFHGPLGSGKRRLLYFFIQQIYEKNFDKIKQYVMYVDCAHGKGIRFIRDQLKFFAKTNIQNKRGLFFKSVVLLNAEKLTTDAQSALRRCIEQFSHTTRFFIVVKNKNKLLKPIQSRFCNIYVPLVRAGEGKINLHLRGYNIKRNYQDVKKKLMKLDGSCTLLQCQQTAANLYEKGINIFDLFEVLENHMPQKKNIYFFLVFFDRIRMEFRNEKLLMFLILYFIFMRHDYDLENMEIV